MWKLTSFKAGNTLNERAPQSEGQAGRFFQLLRVLKIQDLISDQHQSNLKSHMKILEYRILPIDKVFISR